MNNKKILVVDDEKIIRDMLVDYLQQDYIVDSAGSGDEALKLDTIADYDLVISDINMPGIPGYKFLDELKKINPKARRVLITAYNIDDYIRMAKENEICNIIAKTTPFNFKELDGIVHSLITKDIFGHEKYMVEDYKIISDDIVKSSKDAKQVWEDVIKNVEELYGQSGELKLVMDELITNSVYHAPKNAEGENKYKEFSEVILEESEYISVKCFADKEKYGISVTDKLGSLDKKTILYKIDRHVNAEGILDCNGRGLFMSRLFADRIIFNIDPGKSTQMLVFNYFSDRFQGYKPIYINQL